MCQIVMATLDFEHKKVKISEPYYTTANKDADFKHFKDFFKGVKRQKPRIILMVSFVLAVH
jgi:hypothetical protein